MNYSQTFIVLLITLLMLPGCSSLRSASKERLQLAGWVQSKQVSTPQQLQFKFSILGEQATGTLHVLTTQSLNVYSLPVQYSVQTYLQPMWVRYWFEFQWRQQHKWHSIKQPLESAQLTQTNVIHFIDGKPQIEQLPTNTAY
jgi:hypothetical protein